MSAQTARVPIVVRLLGALMVLLAGYYSTIMLPDVAAEEPRIFAAFEPRVEIDIEDGEIDMTTTFTLDASSNGLDLATEILSFRMIGGPVTYAVVIPAGSFNADKSGRWTYRGTIDKVKLIGMLRSSGTNTFEFALETADLPLQGIVSPVTITLTIGDDGGSQTVKARIE